MASKYFLPMIELQDGSKQLLLNQVGVIPIKKGEHALLMVNSEDEIAALYVYEELKDIAHWLTQNPNVKIIRNPDTQETKELENIETEKDSPESP